MKRLLGALLVASIPLAAPARGQDQPASEVLDKGIRALGGAEQLGKPIAWKAEGTLTFNDNASKIQTKGFAEGIDRYRGEFEGDFGGNTVNVVTVVNGDKAWRRFSDMTMALEGDMLANARRSIYLQLGPLTLLPLKGRGFKLESAGEEKVGDAPASVLKVTGPDGKDFRLAFDKASGLPVKMVARVAGFNGDEFTQETTFADYKDFDGVKRATKVTSRRDGDPFLEQRVTDFRVLDKVEPGTFDEPK